MKKIFVLLILTLCLTACGDKGYKIITSTEAQDLLKNDAILIDVRSAEEHNKFYIKDSINVPLDNIQELPDLIEDKETVIILYCETGERSKEAAKKLAKLGYKNLYSLDGGLINWGYGVEEGS